MKLIEAKCPKCKELITVDGDSDFTKCEKCDEKIDVKEALLEKMMSSGSEKPKKVEKKKEKIIEDVEDEEEIEEDIEEEIPVKEKKTTKKVSKKSDKFISYFLKAEEAFDSKEYDEALDNYNLALKEDPDEKYCLFKKSYTSFRKNRLDRESLIDSYETLKYLDYYLDEDGEKQTDVEVVIEDFIAFVYRQASQIHYNIKGKTGTLLEKVKAYFNILYSYLYVFEKLNNEDISDELKEKILIYILGVIDFLTETYYCGVDGRTKFRDSSNISLLRDKKEIYTAQLNAIDPSYKESIKNENDIIEKKNKQIRKDAKKDEYLIDRFFDFIIEHPNMKLLLLLVFVLVCLLIKAIFLS